MNGERRKGLELGLKQLIGLLRKKLWFIALIMALCAAASVALSLFVVKPIYRSSAMLYVNLTVISVEDDSQQTTEPNGEQTDQGGILDSGLISASKSLIDSYRVILQTRETLQAVIDHSGVDITAEELRDMVQITSVGGTEVFQVTVTGHQSQQVWQLATSVCQVLPDRITEIVEKSRVKIVEEPVLSTSPSAPSHSLNALIGLYASFLLSATILILSELMQVHVRTEDDAIRYTEAPVLAAIPDMNSSGRGSYYGYVSKLQHPWLSLKGKRSLVGSDISFEASEAYKLLRTNLEVSLGGKDQCTVLGVTSTTAGEGKSLTAANLAYTMAQRNLRVLLIDADLRRPSVGTKLPVVKSPGLSDWLCNQCSFRQMVQLCGLKEEEESFHVISSGRTVPNPVELLGSPRFDALLGELRRRYDYIIIDLPPAGDVSDPLVVSAVTDGILLVVRPDVCRCRDLTRVVEQLRYARRRLVGVVYNCASQRTRGDYAKKYYGKEKRGYTGNYVAK